MQNTYQLCNTQGNLIQLGQQLGSGGEGAVYEVQGQPDKVAKVYHKPVDSKQAAKLSSMVSAKTSRLVEISAWPTDILQDKTCGALHGLIMPKVENHREIHHLYGPAHRKRDFPSADWAFLIHAARNVASVFEIIHRHGHVIGDVNQGNILVAADATCKLIDCDSFQIVSGNQTFSCDVGVPQFTPPELQKTPFNSIVRTQNHDNFGLALICFHLLFMGRHPFSGRYSGPEDMPIEKAIEEFRFAYGASAASKKMAPPPHTLGLDVITPQLRNLLERAFAQSSVQHNSRPTPKEWIKELDTLRNSLRSCTQNSIHKYYGSLNSCPWCNLEQSSGVIYFLFTVNGVVGGIFDINQVWAQIEAIQLPVKSNFPLPVSSTNCIPVPLTPLPTFSPLPAIPTLSSFPPLPPLPSFQELPVIPTLSSFEPLPPLPSFPPLPVPLPSADPPAAIPSIVQRSQLRKIFWRVNKIRFIVLLILFTASVFLKSSLIFVFSLIYFLHSMSLVKHEISRRKRVLREAESYICQEIAARECNLYKIKLEIDTEMQCREKITTEAKEKNNIVTLRRQETINKAKLDNENEIKRRQKVIDKAKLDNENEIKRRQEIINQAKEKNDIEVASRNTILNQARDRANMEVLRRKRNLEDIRSEWNKSKDDWDRIEWNQDFYRKLQELKQARQKWYELKASYDSEKSQAILAAYLDTFLLQDAMIPGIGEKRITVLRSWGIETAEDITEIKVIQVPGFGPKRTGDLIAWRKGLEAKFHSLPQSTKNISTPNLDQKYAQQRLPLERALRSGPEELQNIKKRIELKQSQFLNQCRQIAQRLAQAEADASVRPV